MAVTIGIRREDKNQWERRVPLVPTDLATLQRDNDLRFIVQPSAIRVYGDDDFRTAGITVGEDLSSAAIVFAVKEIPTELLLPGQTYAYFAHVIKGQTYNMPMLRRLLELGCSLVEYERIADEQGRRMIFFSLHAGYAGMIETLWCLGQRWREQGIGTALASVRHAYEYHDLEAAKAHLRELGEQLRQEGLPGDLAPVVFGIAGYGNVSQGAQVVLDCLPVTEIAVEDLASAAQDSSPPSPLLKVVFREEHMVEPATPEVQFELQDYYQHPEKYRGSFFEHLPHLDVLVNTIYWEDRYPRLVTKQWAAENYGTDRQTRLQVIGDISCDIEGSIELTVEATEPDRSCYVYNPRTGAIQDGVRGHGPVIMPVDNLPCELPRESSQHFSNTLLDMVPALAAADWSGEFAALDLPSHLKKAVIVFRGELTPEYQYLSQYVGA